MLPPGKTGTLVESDNLEGVIRQERYEVLERLGQGSHGIVYRALDKRNNHEVAVKTLRFGDPESLFRLKREFRSLATIKHRNLASLYELQVQDDVFISMEYIRGGDLLSSLRGLSPAQRCQRLRVYLPQILQGLAKLHANDKLHRDIKPGNVLVEGDRVVLVDFGMTTGLDSRASMMSIHSGMAGTLAYMAPEQLHSEALSSATDLFSVGVLLYECLTGELPRKSVPEILDTESTPSAPIEVEPGVSGDLSDLCMQLMLSQPSSRPQIAPVLQQLGVPDEVVSTSESTSVAIGREAELAQLHRELDRVHQGEAVSVAVRGPSGIGKSSLIESFLDRIEQRNEAQVFRSRCHPSEHIRYEALDGLIDEISRFLSHLPADQIDAYLPRHVAALAKVFPVLSRVLPPHHRPRSLQTDDRELRRLAFEAIRELIARIGDRKATVCWIDDLQWGDFDSANLVREILRQPDAPPVLFIFSYRSGELDSPLLYDLETSDSAVWRSVKNIDLQPLSVSSAESLLSTYLAERQWSAQVRDLLAEANGSPFMIAELAKSIGGATGHAQPDLGKIRLEELLGHRLTNLPPDLFRQLAFVASSEGPIARTTVFAACTSDRAGIDIASVLESENLIKTVHIGSELAFDTYHDQIRSAMLESLNAETRTHIHADILGVLEQESSSGPALLAFHALRAGEMESLVRYSIAAAEAAEQGLAFNLAAEFYHQALEYGVHAPGEQADLLERGGKASALAGSGLVAAKLLASAADILASMNASRVNEVRAKAAEQYFASGYLLEGYAILEPLMKQRNIPFPRSANTATLRVIPILLRLRIFGVRPARTQVPSSVELPSDIDLLWSVAKGLSALDTVRASFFVCLGLRLALAQGNLASVARFQSTLAGTALVPAGGALKRWGLKLLKGAEDLAEELDDPYLRGLITVGRGQVSLQSGAWKRALALCDEGMAQLKENATGVAWECDLAMMGAIRALEEVGDFTEMYARSEHMLIQSESVADKYAVAVARGCRMIARVAGDELDLAAEDSASLTELSSSSVSSHLHFIYAVRGMAMVELARGNSQEAWRLIDAVWPRLKSSGLLFAQIVRIDMWSLRARVALATATAQPGRLRLVRQAEKLLAGEERLDSRAWATLISGLCCWHLNQGQVEAQLNHAADQFEEADQTAMAAVCRYRSAQYCQDDLEEQLQTRALQHCGVVKPENWAHVMMPIGVKTN